MADFNPTGGVASTTVNAAGSGGTGAGVTFWSPSKYAMIVDSRPVPGMNTFTGTNGAPTNFIQAVSGLSAGVAPPTGVANDPGYVGDPSGGPSPYTGAVSTLNRPPLESGTTSSSSLGGAMNQLLTFGASADPTAVQSLQDQLVRAGFLDPTKKGYNDGSISGTSDPTYSAYYQLLETSIRTGTDYNAILQARISRDAGKKYEDALQAKRDKVKKQQEAAAAALLPQTINRTATQISDPLTAQNLMTQTLQNELGRAPTPAEVSQFTSALQTAQAQNPTTTTAVTDPGQVQDKSSVQTGGFDPSQFTQNYIDQNFSAEKSAVGGATGFYQAALSAIRGNY